MTALEIFDEYRQTCSAPIPRDSGGLEGMYVLRRCAGPQQFSLGIVSMVAPARGQFRLVEYTNLNRPAWIALSALTENAILFYGENEARTLHRKLARAWQQEHAVKPGEHA